VSIAAVARAGALAALGASSLVACGELPDKVERAQVGATPVTRAQIASRRPGSPERAFLAWYRGVQTGDVEAMARTYAPRLRLTPAKLRFLRNAALGEIRYLGSPRIIEVERHGREAVVYTMIPRETRYPNGRREVYRRPRAFRLERTGGAWGLSDNLYLAIAAEKALGTAPKNP
jgi:hypothetical protein